MQLVDTIPIAFHGGSYGTYLEWLLTTLCSDSEIVTPFQSSGSSHNFKGNHLSNIDGWHKYSQSVCFSQFVRFHPKSTKEESLGGNLDCVLSQVDRMIYLYPDPQSKLLVINNYFTKIWNDWWVYQFDKDISPEKIYNNWPIDPATPLDQVPNWIRREFLSFYLMPAWLDQLEWYHPDRWSNPNCLLITVSDLLYDLDNSLKKIQNFCNLKFKKPIGQLHESHETMLKLQPYLNQDQLCNQIVQSTLNDSELEWKSLPLASESWVQWQLRNSGFEIFCDKLDTFPTNSVQLKKLIYSI